MTSQQKISNVLLSGNVLPEVTLSCCLPLPCWKACASEAHYWLQYGLCREKLPNDMTGAMSGHQAPRGKEAVRGDERPLNLIFSSVLPSPHSCSSLWACSPVLPLTLGLNPWGLDLLPCTFGQHSFAHRELSNICTELVKSDHFLNPNCLKSKETWVRHIGDPSCLLDLLNPVLDVTQASCRLAGIKYEILSRTPTP